MCGIIGFIGKSLNPEVSFKLANALLIKTQPRGDHATGFWACEQGEQGGILYDKEPVKSSEYVTRDIWKKDFHKANCDLMVGHCRMSSIINSEKINKNNHPHVSKDWRIALVHNGKIPEYSGLKSLYETNSDCDSEILLRIFESGDNFQDNQELIDKKFPKDKFADFSHYMGYRLLGVKDIFAHVNHGMMAVAIGERLDDGYRHLWLFRDKDKPLHVIDLRDTLGQIFFFSSIEVWKDATEFYPEIKNFLSQDKEILEQPMLEAWLISLSPVADPDPSKVWSIKKFKITKSKSEERDVDEEATKFVSKRAAKPPVAIISRLNEREEIEKEEKSSPPPIPKNETRTETTEAEIIKPSAMAEMNLVQPSKPQEYKEVMSIDSLRSLGKEINEEIEKLTTLSDTKMKDSALNQKDAETIERTFRAIKVDLVELRLLLG